MSLISKRRTVLLEEGDRSLKSRLKDIFERQATVAAGSIQLIGLDALREKIGARWSSVREKVHIFVQRIMMNMLSPQDAWFRYGDDGYIVVFASLDKNAAQLICGKLIAEIHRNLLGDPDVGEIVVNTVVFDVDGRLALESADLGELLREAVRRQQPMEQRAAVASSAPPPGDAAVNEINESNDNTHRLESLRAAVQGHVGQRRPHVVFRAVWDVQKAVFSTYRCVPARGAARYNAISGYDVLPDPEDSDAIFSLDCETLTKSLTIAVELYHNNFRYFSCVPLHFESLANSKRRMEYLQLLKVAPKDVMQFVEFSIHGLPLGVPLGRLLEIKTFLRPHCRLIFPILDHDERNLSTYAQSGLKVIGTRVPPTLAETEAVERLRAFGMSARKNGLTAYAAGIRTEAMFDAACAAGARYLSGSYFGPDQEYPQHMRHCGKEEIRQAAEKRAAPIIVPLR